MFVKKRMTDRDIDNIVSEHVPSNNVDDSDVLYAAKILQSDGIRDFYDIRLALVQSVEIPDSPVER